MDPVPDLGLRAQLRLLLASKVFNLCNLMEILERLAYYGLRVVAPVYMVLAVELGGPELSHIQKGLVYGWWAFVQSMVPVLSGGFADRYGYKKTIAIAIAIKTVGYLIMGWCVEMAAVVSGGASVGVPGHWATFASFTTGALFLAFGTAVFKPGLQGMLALSMAPGTRVTGWAVFYQLVNVGGFLGPFLAGVMRLLDWKYVFVSCAVIVCLNYVVLLMFKEPEHSGEGFGEAKWRSILWQSFIGMWQPRLFCFIVLFSGFWLMFFQLFDILPNFITDWVDSSGPLQAVAAPIIELFGGTVPTEWNGNLPQEHMINLNAAMCMTLAFLAGYLTSRVRALSAMAVGIGISCVAIWALGFSMNGWYTLMAIAGFSIGEITASPRKAEYLASLAPPGREGLYLGYVNATQAIGWSLGSVLAGALYEGGGDKVVLARRTLINSFQWDASKVEAMQKTDVLPALQQALGMSAAETRTYLWDTYEPNSMWAVFALIGVSSMLALFFYGWLVKRVREGAEGVFLALAVFYAWFVHDETMFYGWFAHGELPLSSFPKFSVGFAAMMFFYLWMAKHRPMWLPVGARKSS